MTRFLAVFAFLSALWFAFTTLRLVLRAMGPDGSSVTAGREYFFPPEREVTWALLGSRRVFYPVHVLIVVMSLVLAVVFAIIAADAGRSVLSSLITVLGVLFAIVVVILVLSVKWAQPKFLMVPSLRGEPGANAAQKAGLTPEDVLEGRYPS